MEDPTAYRAYLLRIWPARPDGRRVTLESVTTGTRVSFPSLDGLMHHLRARLDAGSEPTRAER